MEISTDTFRRLLAEAFDLGYYNSNEFREQLIEDLLAKSEDTGLDEFRIYKCSELKQLPEGTVFNHSTRGRCWIIKHSSSIMKAMQFQSGEVIAFTADMDPWNVPMKLLHSSS